jgi:hypothetical protein
LGDHDPEGEAGVDNLGIDRFGSDQAALGQRAEPVSPAKAMPSSIVSNVCPSKMVGRMQPPVTSQ